MNTLKDAFRARSAPRLTWWDKLKLWRALKDKDMLNKLKSRKLWVTVAVAALSALLSGLGFENDLIEKIVNMGMTYVAAQGLVDVAAIRLAPQAPSPQPQA